VCLLINQSNQAKPTATKGHKRKKRHTQQQTHKEERKKKTRQNRQHVALHLHFLCFSFVAVALLILSTLHSYFAPPPPPEEAEAAAEGTDPPANIPASTILGTSTDNQGPNPSASACAMPNRGTFFAQSGWK
jgi:hypothetical protein